MNNTIQTIIEMDKAARERIRRADAEAKRITEAAEKKLSNLEQAAKAQAEAEIRKECAEINKASEKEIEKINSEADEKCRKLDLIMKDNADSMRKNIVDRILGEV